MIKQSKSRQMMASAVAWYDSEIGYTHTLVDHVIKTGAVIK